MIFLFSFVVSKFWPILPIYLAFLHKKMKFYKKERKEREFMGKQSHWLRVETSQPWANDTS
jgi:hypothetical protein